MIQYQFLFDQGQQVNFSLDETGDTSAEENFPSPPEWTRLELFQCPLCEIPAGSRKSCPAALSILPLVEAFSGHVSHDEVEVRVFRDEAQHRARTTLQQAIRSVAGLMLALSACPVMNRMRPMAHFHLPLGNQEHTVFRAMGMYLVAQYLRQVQGQGPDWTLDGLKEHYDKVHEVNGHLAKRIRRACERDAAINSLIILDTFGYGVQLSIDFKLEELKPLFSMYFDE